jgi:hypothetical protein
MRFVGDSARFVPDVCNDSVIALDDDVASTQVTPPAAGGGWETLLVSPGYELSRRDVADAGVEPER